MLKEFKQFLLRGNVVDLAVGVVIGAAFGTIVTSLVEDVITPLIAAVGGQPDFSALKLTINGSAIMYGKFLNALIAFLIIAAVIFFGVVKPMNHLINRAKRGQEVGTGEKECPECLSMIPAKAKRCKHCGVKVS
ncbi:large conductance mechanosensitive channel protein MscL [Patescibacteria group bacterium]|nr:MAG: large conductance mechanosensitive channel protein MscL [Patescibacteria group bacterium]